MYKPDKENKNDITELYLLYAKLRKRNQNVLFEFWIRIF